MSVKAIPEGYHTVTPYLIVKGALEAIAFYKKAFGAEELYHMDGPDGLVAHAEIKIGNCVLMLADEMATHKGPNTLGGTSVSLMIYIEDCDTVFKRALAAGATQVEPLEDKFYGDRAGQVKDPFGHVWAIGTHVEDVSPEEMEKRMAEMA